MLLADKVVVVTGAGRGIGRAIALAMAEQGAAVVVNDYGVSLDGREPSSEPANQVVAEITAAGGRAVANPDSVASMEGAARMVQTALDSFGRVDVLVHSAGILRDRMFQNMSEEEWDAVLAVHLKGMFATSKAVAPYFREQHSGRIIGLISSAGLLGKVGQCNYAAAKSGVVGFILSIAKELARYNVTANAIVAGPTATRMTEAWQQALAARGEDPAKLALKEPVAVAPLAVYLASDEAAFVSGQLVGLDGAGHTLALWRGWEEGREAYHPSGWGLEALREHFTSSIGRALQ